MRKSLHLGDERRVPLEEIIEEVVEEMVEDEIFNPEAAKVDDNPFPTEEEVVEETTPLEEEGPTDYDSMTVEELRALCRARELPVAGKKADLVARLLDADAPSEEAVEVAEDAPSEEAVSSDETGSVSNESEPNETTDAVG